MQTLPATRFRVWYRRPAYWLLALFGLGLLGAMVVLSVSDWMIGAEFDRVFTHLDQVPARQTALVLGTTPNTLFFEYRLDAAMKLYQSGKVSRILVSGGVANGLGEADLMKAGLVARGVPPEAIICDNAGWRTLDSVARAYTVYDLRKVIIVSQGAHLPRALFLAQHWGLDAVGYSAVDPSSPLDRAEIREWLARVLAVVDVAIDRQPRETGEAAFKKSPVPAAPSP